MAVDFRTFGVAAVSIWMGILLTERFKNIIATAPEQLSHLSDEAETPEFTGHLIWALFNDPGLMDKSGHTFIGAELAVEYGIKDDGDRQPPSYRDLHGVHPLKQFDRILR
jgi:hypothetical protein